MMKPMHIHAETMIRTSPDKLWEIVSRFGDVDRFHAGVAESHAAEGSDVRAAPGCQRVCNIVDMGLRITLKERIVDYVDGRSYTFEVYEWKNFPIHSMRFGFTVTGNGPAAATLAIDILYLARPAFLTPLLAPKMRRLARDVLLGYRHFAETGERRVPIRRLKRLYSSAQPAQVLHG